MWALFFRTIKDRKISLLIYCLTSLLFLWMYLALFPYVQEKSEEFNKLMETYPKSFLDAFGIEAGELWFDKLENFLAVEHFSFIWPIMVIALIVAIGGYAVAGEVERETIEILLAQPVSRVKLFFGKYLAGIFNLLAFTLISIFAVVPLAKAYNIDYQFNHYISVAILGFMFGLAVFSIATLFSCIFSEKGKAYFITVGILVVMYVINIAASLKENLRDLRYFSFFYYFDSSRALINNQIDSLAFWIFLGTAAICTILGAYWFSKRDIAVP